MKQQRWEESEKRKEQKRKAQRRETVRRKKSKTREMVEKSRSTVFFQRFVAPDGRKIRFAKAAGA